MLPMFNQGEVQQLRKILSDQIYIIELLAESEKDAAHYYKETGCNGLTSYHWKEHFKARAKIKKLAALQVKLKSVDVLY